MYLKTSIKCLEVHNNLDAYVKSSTEIKSLTEKPVKVFFLYSHIQNVKNVVGFGEIFAKFRGCH